MPFGKSSAIFSQSFVNADDGIVLERNSSSTYSSQKEYEMAKYAQEYLFDAAKNAKTTYDKYGRDMGVFDAAWQILKPFANFFSDKNVTTFSEMDEIVKSTYKDSLNVYKSGDKAKFEFAFENNRGVRFDAAKVEDFKTKSEEYMTALAYKDKYDMLEKGIKELKQIFSKEKALDAQKAAGAMVMPSAYPEISSDEKFAQIIDEFCQGNEELKEQFMASVAQNVSSKDDYEKNFVQILENLQNEAKKSYEEKLNGRTFEEYKTDYEKAFSETFGGQNAKELTDAWVMNQKQGASFLRMSADIAATMMLGGSNLVARGSTALASKVGTSAAKQIVKTGVTTFGVAADGAFQAVNAATSSTGLTKEKSEEIMQSMLDMAPYAFFGAFVSGPMGDFVQKTLSSSTAAMPQILEKAFNVSAKGAGMVTEVSADTFFTNLLTDGDMLEALKGNAQGETQARVLNKFMSMLVGGSANKATIKAFQDAIKDSGLDGYKVRKTDNGYELVSPDGEITNLNERTKMPETAEITGKSNEAENISKKGEQKNAESAESGVKSGKKPVMTDAEFEKLKAELAQSLSQDGMNSSAAKFILDNIDKDNIESRKEMYNLLKSDEDFPQEEIGRILYSTNETNIELAKMLCTDKDFPKDEIGYVLYRTDETNIELTKMLCTDKDFPKDEIGYVLGHTNETNIELAKMMCSDTDFPKDQIRHVLANTNETNIELAKMLCADKDFPKDEIGYVLDSTNETNIELAKMMCSDKDFPNEQILGVLGRTNETNIELAKMLCADKDFPNEQILGVLDRTNETNIELAKMVCADKDFPKGKIWSVLGKTNETNIELAKMMCSDKDFPKYQIEDVLARTNETNIELAKMVCADKDFPKDKIGFVIGKTNVINIELAKMLCTDKDFPQDKIGDVLARTNDANIELAKMLCADKDFPMEKIERILYYTNETNIELAKMMCSDKDFPKYQIADVLYYTNGTNIELAKMMFADTDFPNDQIEGILYSTNDANVELAKMMFADTDFPKDQIAGVLYNTNETNIESKKEIYNLLKTDTDFPKDKIADVLKMTDGCNIELAKMLCTDKDFPKDKIEDVLVRTNETNIELAKMVCADKDFPKYQIADVLCYTNETNIDFAKNLCQNYKKLEVSPEHISLLLYEKAGVSLKQLQKLRHKMGRENLGKLSQADIVIAAKFVDIYGKNSINEISISGKQEMLKSLVGSNTELFNIRDDMKKMFPLLPTDKDSYCSLLPSLVKSLGVDIRTIEPPERIQEFNRNLGGLSSSLSKISDADFASLDIKLDYPKDEFITNVLSIVKDLPANERQKVYDYFGFELYHNKKNQTGFSITGYPINLNNGKKLAEITDPNTKAVVEKLRPEVIKFSEQNPIKCSNPQVEELLNKVIDVMPELRTQIGKVQHGTQVFDVFKHSLKVMQKVAQDPKFETLNESDKKIMMLASLLHDITKAEGYTDKTHAKQGGFDTFFIAKKFNLSKEEEIKLYTLTRNHEWLEYANTAKSEQILTKRLQSVAYDLQNDNLFDMALMFTHADLKAVKADDSFHDTTEGKSRVSFDGTVRSFGQSADVYAERIRDYVKELQKSQPLLPQTKLPAANRVDEAITKVNADGSTNIKGVYKDKDGLIIIKYNEVEDWEAIGFPKGSVSHGITAKGRNNSGVETDVDTGNIKFFVHGLDYENQLSKFDAFSLIDSDALLSISYAERPESKYRFFRPQGVILDFDAKYIHGGGESDSGSGFGKTIDTFKADYIFGGVRKSDRLFVSNLIKEATGMDDAQYVQFVKENANKPFAEIEPLETREKIIKALATIQSTVRGGKREYNEMYGSNPNGVMGVFAYNIDYNETIGNPVDFLNRKVLGEHDKGYNGADEKSVYERTEFLRRYALEHNVPFIVFGD